MAEQIPDVRIELETNSGPITLMVPAEFLHSGEPFYLEWMALLVNNQPVLRVPFYLHGATSLHTICTRELDDEGREIVITEEI